MTEMNCTIEQSAKSNKRNYKHGMSFTPEYNAWANIKDRCFNPNNESYRRYGGRGIKMHGAWVNDFLAFYEEIGPKPGPGYSVDRINNNGNYEPGNIRWATQTMQARNTSTVTSLVFNGEEKTTPEWADDLGIRGGTIRERLRRGWGVEKTLTTPLQEAPTYQYKDIEGTISFIIEQSGCKLDPNVVSSRICQGWTVEEAIETPLFEPKTFEFNGEAKTLFEWANDYNMSPSILRTRVIDLDWPLDKALTEPVNKTLYSYKGVEGDLAKLAKEFNFNYFMVWNRLNEGWSLEEAIETPKRGLLLSYKGEEKYLAEWAEEYGLNRGFLYDRIVRWGWTLEKALTTPPKGTIYKYKGLEGTLPQIAKALNINCVTLRTRMKRGMTIEEAIEFKRKSKTVMYEGQERTITSLAKEYNISRDLIYTRIEELGWSVEKALTTPKNSR